MNPPGACRLRAALSLVTLTMAVAAGCSSPPPPAAVPAAGPLRAVSPAGPVSWPFAFTWEGADQTAVVRLRVFDAAERMVYGLEARGATSSAPEALRPLLQPGATYQWRVARIDENGDERDQSDLTPFSVR